MDSPKTITANWKTDYTQLFMLIGGIVLLAAIPITIVVVRRNRA